MALIPILSDVRGISVVLKKWARKDRLPDAIVIEHPFFAGGHLGATRLEDLDEPRFDFEVVIPGALELFEHDGNRSPEHSADRRRRDQQPREAQARSSRWAPVRRRWARRSP